MDRYTDFKFAVVYFISDRTFEVVELEWNEKDYESFMDGKLTSLNAFYNNVQERGVIMQVATDEIGLEAACTYLANVKREKKWNIQKIWERRLIPSIQPKKRRRMLPMTQLTTDDTEDKIFLPEPSKQVNEDFSFQKVILPSCDIPSEQENRSLHEGVEHDSMISCTSKTSRVLTTSFEKSVMKKLCLIEAKLDMEFKKLNERLDQLTNYRSHQTKSLMQPLNLKDEAEYDRFCEQVKEESYRTHLVDTLSANGGQNEYRMCVRCVDFLLETTFQIKFNWIGSRGKKAFNSIMGPIVKDAVYRTFPAANLSAVERKISRHLILAADRAGGRTARRHETASKN